MTQFTLKVEVACVLCHSVLGVVVQSVEPDTEIQTEMPITHECQGKLYHVEAIGYARATDITPNGDLYRAALSAWKRAAVPRPSDAG